MESVINERAVVAAARKRGPPTGRRSSAPPARSRAPRMRSSICYPATCATRSSPSLARQRL